MSTIGSKKREMRQHFLKLRRELASLITPIEKRRLLDNTRRCVTDLAPLQVCAYHPKADEANPLYSKLQDFFFPKVTGDNLGFFRPKTSAALQPGAFSVLEPTSASEALDRNHQTVVLCPVVAVDAGGQRLGMGRGFYDRFLKSFPRAIRVGVVFHKQVAWESLPAESSDEPLDWVVTERMILKTAARRSL